MKEVGNINWHKVADKQFKHMPLNYRRDWQEMREMVEKRY